ncbi:MAG: Lrp/AsnC ligand binding domain-containing protein [Solirubrobacteraceae bacterium]
MRGLRGPADTMLDWFVRVRVTPGGAGRLAQALAARVDVSWVSITAGGTEVVCSTRPRTAEQRDALLLERLPRASPVTSLTAHAILRRYAGSGENEWRAFGDPLSPHQVEALTASRGPRPTGVVTNPPREPGARLTAEDEPLAAALHEDGRAGYAQLAAATGWSPGQIRRRLEALLASRALYVDTEIATSLLGMAASALLWMTAAPSVLVEAAERLAAAPETAFVAAVSGPANLHATVACRDTEHLYDFIIRELPAIQTVETSPIERQVKAAGSIIEHGRLPRPF